MNTAWRFDAALEDLALPNLILVIYITSLTAAFRNHAGEAGLVPTTTPPVKHASISLLFGP